MIIALLAIINYHQNSDFLTLQVFDFVLILSNNVYAHISPSHLSYTTLKENYTIHKKYPSLVFLKLSEAKSL